MVYRQINSDIADCKSFFVIEFGDIYNAFTDST